MDKNNLDLQPHYRRALQRLGTAHPLCVCCGEDNALCLERHHVQGQAYGSDIAIVCRNCHRKLSVAQRSVVGSSPNTSEDLLGRFLLGVSDLLMLIAARLQEFGRQLMQHAKGAVA